MPYSFITVKGGNTMPKLVITTNRTETEFLWLEAKLYDALVRADGVVEKIQLMDLNEAIGVQAIRKNPENTEIATHDIAEAIVNKLCNKLGLIEKYGFKDVHETHSMNASSYVHERYVYRLESKN